MVIKGNQTPDFNFGFFCGYPKVFLKFQTVDKVSDFLDRVLFL